MDSLTRALIEYLERQPDDWKQIVPISKELGLSKRVLKSLSIEHSGSSVVLDKHQTIRLLKHNRRFRRFFTRLMVQYALEIFSRGARE